MTALAPTSLGNLDAKRLQRAAQRAARQEARGETLPIIFGGQTIATLEAEFALYVLEPIQDINLDIALLFQQAVAAANSKGDSNAQNMELIVNILAANPNLPREFITAIKEIGLRLLGEEGYALFVAQRPTPWDVAALVSILMSWYGVTMGEFLGSSTASTSGSTSKTTSGPTVESMPEASGSVPAIPGSLVSVEQHS